MALTVALANAAMQKARCEALIHRMLPDLRHDWEIRYEEFYSPMTLDHHEYWVAITRRYPKRTVGPCETPEALAAALALIDPTLEY